MKRAIVRRVKLTACDTIMNDDIQRKAILVRKGNDLYHVLDTELYNDNSMAVSCIDDDTGSMQFIVDDLECRLEAGSFRTERAYTNSIIRFHTDMNAARGDIFTVNDTQRNGCTINAVPTKRIRYPVRLMEVVLPKKLAKLEGLPQPRDLILSCGSFRRSTLRCTISCMPTESYWIIMDNQRQIVNSSAMENNKPIEHGGYIWLFTLRATLRDTHTPDCFMSFIPCRIDIIPSTKNKTVS